MKTRELNLAEVRRLINLLRQCDGETDIKVADLAKEGGWKKTDLTEFINENIGHFNIKQKMSKTFRKVNGYETYVEKPLGLYITEEYENVIDNPETEEWLQDHIKRYKKTIWLSETYDDYGSWNCTYVYSMCIPNNEREAMWKNPKQVFDKVKKLGKDFIHYDNGSNCIHFRHSEEFIQLLENNGWEVNLMK